MNSLGGQVRMLKASSFSPPFGCQRFPNSWEGERFIVFDQARLVLLRPLIKSVRNYEAAASLAKRWLGAARLRLRVYHARSTLTVLCPEGDQAPTEVRELARVIGQQPLWSVDGSSGHRDVCDVSGRQREGDRSAAIIGQICSFF